MLKKCRMLSHRTYPEVAYRSRAQSSSFTVFSILATRSRTGISLPLSRRMEKAAWMSFAANALVGASCLSFGISIFLSSATLCGSGVTVDKSNELLSELLFAHQKLHDVAVLADIGTQISGWKLSAEKKVTKRTNSVFKHDACGSTARFAVEYS